MAHCIIFVNFISLFPFFVSTSCMHVRIVKRSHCKRVFSVPFFRNSPFLFALHCGAVGCVWHTRDLYANTPLMRVIMAALTAHWHSNLLPWQFITGSISITARYSSNPSALGEWWMMVSCYIPGRFKPHSAECSLIIRTGCWVQIFSLILDSSVGLWVGIQSAGE